MSTIKQIAGAILIAGWLAGRAVVHGVRRLFGGRKRPPGGGSGGEI